MDHSPHRRILLVEHDLQKGQEMRQALTDAHFEVDGPYADQRDGMAAIAEHLPDGAVIDAALGARDLSMLIDDLQQYGVPVLMCPAEKSARRLGDSREMTLLPSTRDVIRLLDTMV